MLFLTQGENENENVYAKDRENTMIFITEGDSASGSIGPSRNVMTQAIFYLRGKPLNTYGHTKSTIYKNEEIYNLKKNT